MNVAFGDRATDEERDHMIDICQELGLPEQILLCTGNLSEVHAMEAE